MKYTLITNKGRVYTFFLLATAEIFQQAYGGALIDTVVDTTTEVAV